MVEKISIIMTLKNDIQMFRLNVDTWNSANITQTYTQRDTHSERVCVREGERKV